MPIGRKIGSLKSLKATLKPSEALVRFIPKNGSITVRFLEEPENWVNYFEHYDAQLRKSYPCIEEGTCPGCATDERRTSRYVANALDVDNDKVIAIQLPKDLVSRLVIKYEKYDTLMDRDYELSRTGEGLDTVYDAEPEPVLARKLTKYKLIDLPDALEAMYTSIFGTGEEEEKKPVRKRAASKAAPSRRRAKFEPEPEDEDEPEEEDEEDLDDEADEEVEDEPEEDDEEDEDEDTEEEEFYTEEDLKAMSIAELRALAREYGIAPQGMKKAEVVEAILGGNGDEEDEPF